MFKGLETTSSPNVIPAGAEGSALLAAIYDVPLVYFVTLPADTRTDGKYLGKTNGPPITKSPTAIDTATDGIRLRIIRTKSGCRFDTVEVWGSSPPGPTIVQSLREFSAEPKRNYTCNSSPVKWHLARVPVVRLPVFATCL